MSERLTREQVEEIRREFRCIPEEGDDLDTLCDMALASLAPQPQREAVVEECIAACKLEWLDEEVEDDDKSYNQAVTDCVSALQVLKSAISPADSAEANDARRYDYVVREGLIDGFIEGYLAEHDMDEAGYPGTPEYKKLADTAIDAALSREGAAHE